MRQRQLLDKLAKNPKSLLSNERGIFSVIKAKEYELFECLCSDKLDREHPEHDVRKFIDTELAKRLDQKINKDNSVHLLDVGSGTLFSSAVRVAELVLRGFKDIHIYLIDPIYGDDIQKGTNPNIHSKTIERAGAAKKAFHEFRRLMQDCGVNAVIGDAQGNTKHIVNDLKDKGTDPNNEATVYLHIFGDIKQVPTDVMQHMDAIVIVDLFPPLSLNKILGNRKDYLNHEALIFSCKERFLSRVEMIDNLNKEDIEHFSPGIDAKMVTEIKHRWDEIVNTLYPNDANGDFDSFYAAVMSKALPERMQSVFDHVLKRISSHALEVRITSGSALQRIDWDDAVDIQGAEAYHNLRLTDEPLPIYSLAQFPLWAKRPSDTPSDEIADEPHDTATKHLSRK